MANITFAVPRKLYFIPPPTAVEVSSQQRFALVRKTDGTSFSWGRNLYGELGNNTLNEYCSPVAVCGSRNFCDIGVGDTHSIGVDNNGQVWAWGEGTYGQIGNGSTASRRTPVSITGSKKTFCSVSGGVYHSAGLDQYGKLWTWGRNLWGELGDKTMIGRCTPVSVSGPFTFCKISAGNSATAAIDKNGKPWGWGYTANGQLGVGSLAGLCRCTPVAMAGVNKTFCFIFQSLNYGMGIDFRGRAWGWGQNSLGRLGDNSSTNRLTPVSVAGAVKTFCKIALSNNTSLSIDKNGQIWGWGQSQVGQLGRGDLVAYSTPVAVCGSTKTFCDVGLGQYTSYAVDNHGTVWSWGYQFDGELGANIPLKYSPLSVTTTKTFCKISIGTYGAVSIDKNGLAFGWGYNGYGSIGDNTAISKNSPVSVLGNLKTFCDISTNYQTLAIDKNGRAWGWGLNIYGQIGDNTTASKRTPVSVGGAIKTFCRITAGGLHSSGITNLGRVWSWGYNLYGALGDNSVTQRNTPVSVAGSVKTFCQITAGEWHTNSIDKNGMVWGWGYNVFGQLGNNTVTSVRTPVSILGTTKTFCKISASQYHVLAIDKNGRAWGWGFNGGGRLGDNTITSRRTPVSVAGAVKTFCKIMAGFSYSLAIDKNGGIWSWGTNNYGQLGVASYTDSYTPRRLHNTTTKTFCEIVSGYNGTNFATAIDKNGVMWSWGQEFYGELGIGSINTFTPISIPYL